MSKVPRNTILSILLISLALGLTAYTVTTAVGLYIVKPATDFKPKIYYPQGDPPLQATVKVDTKDNLVAYQFWWMWNHDGPFPTTDWEPYYVYYDVFKQELTIFMTRFHYNWFQDNIVIENGKPVIGFYNTFHSPDSMTSGNAQSLGLATSDYGLNTCPPLCVDPNITPVTDPWSLVITTPITTDFIWSPTTPLTGQTVTFIATVTTTSPVKIDYSWDFGDGSGTIATNNTITHIYSASDIYNVTVSTTDETGSSLGIRTKQITIRQSSSEIGLTFAWSPSPARVGKETLFIATVSGGTPPYSFEWRIADGITVTKTGQNISYTFTLAGDHVVQLNVIDSIGDGKTITNLVTVISEQSTFPFSIVMGVTTFFASFTGLFLLTSVKGRLSYSPFSSKLRGEK